MILVVTGSRSWRHPQFIGFVLNAFYVRSGAFVLYHGDCRDWNGNPCGADRYADEWAKTNPKVTVRARPADWNRYRNGAGPIRNKAMILEALAEAESLDNIRVAAFPSGRSPGTYGAIKIAEALGINVKTWTEADVPLWARAA